MSLTISGMLDIAIAAVDMTSDTAKNFQSIRSKVRRPTEDDEVVPMSLPVPISDE